MSNVLRPNRNALAWLLSCIRNSPTAGSANGACQPPWGKDSLASSSGPPGACITPSRVRNVCTVSFMWFSSVRFEWPQLRPHHQNERDRLQSTRSRRKCGFPGPPVRRCQTVNGLVGVEAAGIRQDPQLRITEPIFLTALHGLRFGERLPIRSEAEHGNHSGLPPPYLRLEFLRTGVQLLEAQLVGTSARRRHDVGDADAEPQTSSRSCSFMPSLTSTKRGVMPAVCSAGQKRLPRRAK